MKIRKNLSPGCVLPAWYGIAWRDWNSDSAVCYPVPLNMVIAAIRGAWIFMRHGYRSLPINPREAYDQGFREGFREAVKHL